MGNITKWDDEAIIKLNPSIASKLPSENIKLGYFGGATLGNFAVFTNALSSMSEEFEAEFNRVGMNMSFMEPSLAGNTVPQPDELSRVIWNKVGICVISAMLIYS